MKNPTKLTLKQRAFVNALLETRGNATQAAIKAGVPAKSADSVASQWMNSPKFRHVQEEYRRLSELATQASVLSAVKVRDFVNGLLDINPLDWFSPTAKGGVWEIGAEAFKDLPKDVGRYISSTHYRRISTEGDEEYVYSVTLMSKEAALAAACKLIEAGQDGERGKATVDWDALSRRRVVEDPVEVKIREQGLKAIADKKQGGDE